jgi:drug/metabolite transporter superfamily protein YnfA
VIDALVTFVARLVAMIAGAFAMWSFLRNLRRDLGELEQVDA